MSIGQEIQVNTDNLLSQVALRHQQGYRFITMTCLNAGDGYDVLYHMEKDFALTTLRLHIVEGQDLPSITCVYLAAVLIENEIQDMFGLKVQGIAIDFKGRLFLSETAPKTPLNKKCGIQVDVRTVTPESKGAAS
jgi:ech hydrogenase subunit D